MQLEKATLNQCVIIFVLLAGVMRNVFLYIDNENVIKGACRESTRSLDELYTHYRLIVRL